MNKIRTIICGTKFGQFYIKGVLKSSDKFELCGIVSRGSERSVQYAKHLNVPLIKNIDAINKNDIDLALVVVKSTISGGEGTKIAKKFLEKGISVVQEHPVFKDEYISLLRTAKSNNCYYYMNTFYTDLVNIDKFIKMSNKILDTNDIKYINAQCSIHVLMPLIDILSKSLKNLRPFKLDVIENFDYSPFSVLIGKVNQIPINLSIQNEFDSIDPENNILTLHKLVYYTDIGNLQLTGSDGYVLWENKINRTYNEHGVCDIYSLNESENLKCTEVLNEKGSYTFKEVYYDIWPDCIKKLLNRVYDDLVFERNIPLAINNQALLEVFDVWEKIYSELRVPKII